MFCLKCGAIVGESQKFCGSCGASIGESQPKPKRSRFARVMLWGLGILVGLFVLYGIISNGEHSTQESAEHNAPSAPPVEARQTQKPSPDEAPQNVAKIPTDSSQPSPPENQPTTYKIGQTFSVGYWSYLCHNAYWTPVLGFNPYSMERANADFVVVDITARNDDTSSSTLPTFQLVDEAGRTYDESSAGMLNEGFFSPLEQLNPGVSKRGNIAFDVPSDRRYYLLLSGGIESGKRAIVILPMSVPLPVVGQMPAPQE